MIQTEFAFQLPKGYLDDSGALHRDGVMRMATASDELSVLRDPRVRSNDAYLVVILLAQVITRIGSIQPVTPEMVEQMFAVDVLYLQDVYRQINGVDMRLAAAICPNCGHQFNHEVPA